MYQGNCCVSSLPTPLPCSVIFSVAEGGQAGVWGALPQSHSGVGRLAALGWEDCALGCSGVSGEEEQGAGAVSAAPL